jgi:hypothetical protein
VNGRCVQNNGGPTTCLCVWDICADDSACPAGQTCACHGSPYEFGEGNHCVPSNCRVDADCGPGGWCSPTFSASLCGVVGGYYCHTSRDTCVNDSDCVDGGVGFACGFDTTVGYWSCMFNLPCP